MRYFLNQFVKMLFKDKLFYFEGRCYRLVQK